MEETTKFMGISITPDEEKELISISKAFFGKSNKSGMVRYWINQAKKERINQIEVKE